jgi:hypothetical protein
VVAVYNVWGVWAANGLRKVTSVTANSFALTDINGTNIVGSGTFCSPASLQGVCNVFQSSYGPLHGINATVSALGAFTLKGHPRVWLDGPGGTLATAITNTSSTGRANPNNAPWSAITASVANLESNGGTNYQTVLISNNLLQPFNVGQFLSAGLNWNALGGANELTVAKWAIDHVEDMAGGTFG